MNDTGGQIRTLGESLLARVHGEPVPEGGYQGEYVTELAATYDGPDEVTAAGRWAAAGILEHIRASLASVGIVFDKWYSQASIEESGPSTTPLPCWPTRAWSSSRTGLPGSAHRAG